MAKTLPYFAIVSRVLHPEAPLEGKPIHRFLNFNSADLVPTQLLPTC